MVSFSAATASLDVMDSLTSMPWASRTTQSDAIVNTVAGVIGMIPEGLVLLTSVSFILGVGRLARKQALVQEMEAIEALARVNVLCLDKTGTITTGDLEVVDVGGLYNGQWIQAVSRWLTTVYTKTTVKLPKTGY